MKSLLHEKSGKLITATGRKTSDAAKAFGGSPAKAKELLASLGDKASGVKLVPASDTTVAAIQAAAEAAKAKAKKARERERAQAKKDKLAVRAAAKKAKATAV